MSTFTVTRCATLRIAPDLRRVITKPFLPGEAMLPEGSTRIDVTVKRILAMPECEVTATLQSTLAEFASRHRAFDAVLEANVALVADRCAIPDDVTADRRRLIGAYFTHEYAIEAAALGNPSIVASPDQSGLDAGQVRFVMTLRAIGEGHISSVEFRTGVVADDLSVTLETPSRYAATGRRSSVLHDRAFFATKLEELDAFDDATAHVLDLLGPSFTTDDLDAAMHKLLGRDDARPIRADSERVLHWLASSNYETTFDPDSELSERVIFPAGPTESQGMEDVRLVRFVHDDGHVVYYGTYTAFDGRQVMPQLLETTDFRSFQISTLGGRCAQNKGIALFPRQLDGQFVALGRHDNVNNFLMTSADIRVWEETEKIQEPERPWELMQLGNCGSPIETEAGWLVITHGVGPMRGYSLGALLLDLDDPSRVVGHLREPLLVPVGDEREGYVPNVVYSCGSMVHRDHLVLPYGFGDVGAGVATIPLAGLLERLTG